MCRVILIGLDGFEPSLTEKWMSEGLLPNLSELRKQGAYLRCNSTMPPATFPAWTTCVTGVNPGRHGIFDFTIIPRGTYRVQFVNSTYRATPAIWNMLSEQNKRVVVLGVPCSYPPENVNGVMVSGFDSPVTTRIDRSFVYPKNLYPLVKDWVFADFQEYHVSKRWYKKALSKLLIGIDTKERITLQLMRDIQWDFFMVVFSESDTVAHHFWSFHDPHSPRHTANPHFEDAISHVYKRLDGVVGKILNNISENTLVVVVSDHGFGGTGTGVLHLNKFLYEGGFLKFQGTPQYPSIRNIALQFIPAQWQGKLFRKFCSIAAYLESRARTSNICWRETIAWSEELNYFPSVRINLKGREPCGTVSPREYDYTCQHLIEYLSSWHPIKKVWHREELYHGEYLDRAPDLILELNTENGYSYSCQKSTPGVPSFYRHHNDKPWGGKHHGMPGSHRSVGTLFLSENVIHPIANLQDIVPTVLSYLGLACPDVDGENLFEKSLSRIDIPLWQQPTPYTPEQEKIIEHRLRSLGYWE